VLKILNNTARSSLVVTDKDFNSGYLILRIFIEVIYINNRILIILKIDFFYLIASINCFNKKSS